MKWFAMLWLLAFCKLSTPLYAVHWSACTIVPGAIYISGHCYLPQTISQILPGTLTDVGLTNSDRLARYVQLLERLLAHAYFIPTNRIQIVVETVLQVSNRQVLYRFHSLLCQDLKLRPSGTTNLPVDYRRTHCTLSATLSPSHPLTYPLGLCYITLLSWNHLSLHRSLPSYWIWLYLHCVCPLWTVSHAIVT